jgi:probable rRNA maturation factor
MSKLNLEINNLTPNKIEEGFLKKTAEKALKFVKIKIPEISLVLVCDARMKSLNKKYRKRNKVTDVLAFDYGEIIICLPQARRQAKELRHSLKDELKILLIHGILHLAGFDDETKAGYKKMMAAQEKIFKSIFIWQKAT